WPSARPKIFIAQNERLIILGCFGLISRLDAASFFAMLPPSPPSHWRSGAGQAHRRWKMCDGWPAGPAPSRFYSTPIGTDPDPDPSLVLLGARLTLWLHDDACGAVRERARATNPLHRAGIDPEPLGDLAHAWPPRSRWSLSDAFFQLEGGLRRSRVVRLSAKMVEIFRSSLTRLLL